MLDPPEPLDDRARKVWEKLAPGLRMTRPWQDAQSLARYCTLVVMWRDAVAFVKKNGTTYPVRATPRGNSAQGRIVGFREFPQAAEIRKLSNALLGIELRLQLGASREPGLWDTPH